MIGITITPDVTPAVYDALAMCMDAAIECAKSATRVMVTLEDPEQQAACEQAVGILETMQRILQRQGSRDPGPQVD